MKMAELKYLVEATNEIHRILLGTINPNQEDLQRVFAIGCNTLKRAAVDAQVELDLRVLAERQDQFLADFKVISGDVNHFVRGFCNIEREAMSKAGINKAAVNALLREAVSLRNSIYNSTINPEEVVENIRKLRDETCAIAKKLHDAPLEAEEKRKANKRLKRLAAGIGGIAIVAINASTLALSMGMSLPGTAVSGGVGSGLIGAAVVID